MFARSWVCYSRSSKSGKEEARKVEGKKNACMGQAIVLVEGPASQRNSDFLYGLCVALLERLRQYSKSRLYPPCRASLLATGL